jgi:hypothetical protein
LASFLVAIRRGPIADDIAGRRARMRSGTRASSIMWTSSELPSLSRAGRVIGASGGDPGFQAGEEAGARPVAGPGAGEVVGIDRGVKVSAALSTGEKLTVPGLTGREAARLRGLQRRLARGRHGSARRAG